MLNPNQVWHPPLQIYGSKISLSKAECIVGELLHSKVDNGNGLDLKLNVVRIRLTGAGRPIKLPPQSPCLLFPRILDRDEGQFAWESSIKQTRSRNGAMT